MATSTITIPEHIKELADARAASNGFAGADEYIAALILANAGEPISSALESHLLRAMERPGIKITAADWDRKRAHLEMKHGRGHLLTPGKLSCERPTSSRILSQFL